MLRNIVSRAARIQAVLEKRKIRELWWNFQPTSPDDPNPIFPDFPVNDQLGVYNSLKPFQIVLGGNRSGKTRIMVKKVYDIATGRHPLVEQGIIRRINSGRIIAPKYEDNVVEVILEIFKEMAIPSDLYGGTWESAWSEKRRKLRFANGSYIRFFSYEQDANVFGGKDLDWVWFNEHCPKYKLYLEAVARVVDRGGIILYDFTPERGVTWEQSEILDRQGVDPDYDVFTFDTRGNPFLSRAGVDRFMKSIQGSALFNAKVSGKMGPLSGMVYDRFSVNRNIIKVSELPPEWHGRLPREWYRMFIIDPHEQKPHYMAIFAVSPERELILEAESEFASPLGVEQLRDHIIGLITNRNVKVLMGDKSRGGASVSNRGQHSILYQLKRDAVDPRSGMTVPGTALNILPSNMYGADDWEYTWNLLNGLIAPDVDTGLSRFYILDSCPLAIYMFNNCVWRDDATETEVLSEKVKPINTEAPDVSRYAAAVMQTLFSSQGATLVSAWS